MKNEQDKTIKINPEERLVSYLELSNRAKNCIRMLGIKEEDNLKSLAEIFSDGDANLLSYPGLGKTTLAELKRKLGDCGIHV
jgi:DNA-directed RNA polymerase alpha subunit